MVYVVYLKQGIGEQIGDAIGTSLKQFTVNDLTITNSCIQKGNKLLPITNVLFIEEEV